mmetsp:Transcript_102495/g.290324  ORF Transcript_102495/g.290324 Transcript_102495/m.290324 type:complete len:306 (+) Transcript_102495:686-1603(+)
MGGQHSGVGWVRSAAPAAAVAGRAGVPTAAPGPRGVERGPRGAAAARPPRAPHGRRGGLGQALRPQPPVALDRGNGRPPGAGRPPAAEGRRGGPAVHRAAEGAARGRRRCCGWGRRPRRALDQRGRLLEALVRRPARLRPAHPQLVILAPEQPQRARFPLGRSRGSLRDPRRRAGRGGVPREVDQASGTLVRLHLRRHVGVEPGVPRNLDRGLLPQQRRGGYASAAPRVGVRRELLASGDAGADPARARAALARQQGHGHAGGVGAAGRDRGVAAAAEGAGRPAARRGRPAAAGAGAPGRHGPLL